jgi:hypothetical protein
MPTQKIWQGLDTAFIYAQTHTVYFHLNLDLLKKMFWKEFFHITYFVDLGDNNSINH